ncbi:phosphodiester glycosidase family protein [Eubacterium ramulus]
MKFWKKPVIYAVIFGVVLMGCNTYALLDTFVISHAMAAVTDSSSSTNTGATDSTDSTDDNNDSSNRDSGSSASGSKKHGHSSGSNETSTDSSSTANESSSETSDTETEKITQTDTSYEDDNISISLDTYEAYDTTYYVADVEVSSAEYLKTALAQNLFGTNVTETTSEQAEDHNAILAINGDYYGANKSGYVIKNGTVYRSSQRSDSEYDDLVIYEDGSFGIINETEVSAEELVEDGVTQLFAFGPTLVENGEVAVSQNTEVGKAMASNPRTAIGIIDACQSYGCLL